MVILFSFFYLSQGTRNLRVSHRDVNGAASFQPVWQQRTE
jgi:hypothetical protein